MTILVGTNVTTSFTVTDDFYDGDRAWWQADGWVADTSGNATSMGLYLYNWDVATAVKLLLLDSTGTLLASTAGLTGSAPGWITGAITSTAVTQGQTYYLALLANASIQPYSDGADWSASYVSMAYASPGNVALPGTNNNKGVFAIYADGTTGGGDVSLALPNTGGATTSTGARGTQTPNLSVPL
jgi:hypothetical protein